MIELDIVNLSGGHREHTNPSGRVRSNGHELGAGDGCAAAARTTHDDFEALTDASYLSIFKL